MDVFKECSGCGAVWKTRDAFLKDPSLTIVGYQVSFTDVSKGLFLFNHSCKSTIAIEVHVFRDLYNGPIYQKCVAGTETCPGYCLHQSKLKPCPAECECAYAREILQVLKERDMST